MPRKATPPPPAPPPLKPSERRALSKVARRGGHARATALSPARRSEIARHAALARWRGAR